MVKVSFHLIIKLEVWDWDGPTLILPFIAYFISRKEPSKGLGIMIIAGILIIVGGAVVIGNADPAAEEESGRDILAETAFR